MIGSGSGPRRDPELRSSSTPDAGDVLSSGHEPLPIMDRTWRLPCRPPYDAAAVGRFLADRVVPGLERHRSGPDGWTHERPVPLPSGDVALEVTPYEDHVLLRMPRCGADQAAALVDRVRRWLDLDADLTAITDHLAEDPVLTAAARARPGLRVPTTVDPWETCVRAVIGQQVTVRGAGTLLGRLVAAYGGTVTAPGGDVAAQDGDPLPLRSFPRPEVLAAAGPEALARTVGMPASRGRTLHGLADAVATGRIRLDDPDRDEVLAALLELPGIGPWTRDYVALRALADPDAFPASDLGLRHAAACLGLPSTPKDLAAAAARWAPWRAYAAQLLWSLPAGPG